MKPILYLIIAILLAVDCQVQCKVIINEIMPAPEGDEPEWIELLNSGTDDVSIVTPYLTDGASSLKVESVITLKSGGYAVLTRDTTTLKSLRQIPPDAGVFQVKLPQLNNTWDWITIRDKDSLLIDSVYFVSTSCPKSISFELVDRNLPSGAPGNLLCSVDPSGATPGRINSLAKLKYDLIAGKPVTNYDSDDIEFMIYNIGYNKISFATVESFIDLNKDSVFTEDELAYKDDITDIGDSALVDIPRPELFAKIISPGKWLCKFVILAEADQRTDNNIAYSNIYKPTEIGAIRINEILYDVSDDRAEFVELWNCSKDTVSLDSWYIRDEAANELKEFLKISGDYRMNPSSYFVIAWDSLIVVNFPELAGADNVYIGKSSMNLNQSGDIVAIINPEYRTEDSVYYHNEWMGIAGGKDVSLEKVNPLLEPNEQSSWGACVDQSKATPGRQNSIFREGQATGGLTIAPNPFAPLQGGQYAKCYISYSVPYKQCSINLKIFDNSGNMLRNLANSEIRPSTGMFSWDGMNDSGYLLGAGAYVVFFEAIDQAGGEVTQYKEMIVIAR